MPDQETGKPLIRVRSLPGYGGFNDNPDEWLEDNPVGASEVVILVMANSMNELDDQILERLLAKGLSPERVLLVRNKFDSVLAPKLKAAGLEPDSPEHSERVNNFRIDFQKELAHELNKHLQLAYTDPDVAGIKQAKMIFTSSKDVCTAEGIDELQSAIGYSLHQVQHTEGSKLWDAFRERRNHPANELSTQWINAFVDAVRGQSSTVFHDLLTALNSNHNLSLPGAEAIRSYLQQFRKIFMYDLEETIAEIRQQLLDTRLNTASIERKANDQLQLEARSDIVAKIARELSERGYFKKRAYVKEKTRIAKQLKNVVREGQTKTLRKTAQKESTRYLSEHRGEVLQRNREHDWVDRLRRDESVLKEFTDKLERLLLADSLEQCLRQGVKEKTKEGEGDHFHLLSDGPASTGIGSPPPSAQSMLENKLVTLARQFARFYLCNIYGPTMYTQPFMYSQPQPLLRQAEKCKQPPAPEVAGLAEPLQPPPLCEGSLRAVFSAGFEKVYHVVPPSFLSRNECTALVSAFEYIKGMRDGISNVANKGTFQIKTENQIEDYSYSVRSARTSVNGGITGTAVVIIHASDDGGSAMQNNIMSGASYRVDYKADNGGDLLMQIMESSVIAFSDHPFSPPSFMYESQLAGKLAITRLPGAMLGDLPTLQTCDKNMAMLALGDGHPFTQPERKPLTEKEVVDLALRLAEGFKALAEHGLHLPRFKLEDLALNHQTMQPFVANPAVLEPDSLDNWNSVDREAFLFLKQRGGGSVSQVSREQRPAHVVKWLGRLFTLLSCKVPDYQPDEHDSSQESDKERVKTVLRQEGVNIPERHMVIGRYSSNNLPTFSGRNTPLQNMLLLATHMLRNDPARRPSLDLVLKGLHKIKLCY